MILIIDNLEERRKNLIIRLRVKGYIVCGISYENVDYYTKPFMTVYINPAKQNIDKIKNDDTISVIFTDRTNHNLPEWAINVPMLNNLENDIISIYQEKCKYQIKDKIDVVGYACLKNDIFALGGEFLNITKMQMPILCLFLFNKNKRFKLYEACQYMYFKTDAEESFIRQVIRINKSAKDKNREKIILNDGDLYYLNPDISNYVCEEENVEDDEAFFYRVNLTDI